MAVNEIIVTGRKFRKCIDEINKKWQRYSFWGKAEDTEFDDGKNAETKLGAIDGITDSLASTSSRIAASAKAVSTLSNDLGGCSFETKEDGAYIKYTLPGGADPVLKKLGSGTIRKFVAGQLEYTYRGLYQFSYNLKESYNEYGKITVEDIFGGIHSVSAGSISANIERVGSASFGEITGYNPETGIINATVNIGTGTNHTIVRVTPCFYIIV